MDYGGMELAEIDGSKSTGQLLAEGKRSILDEHGYVDARIAISASSQDYVTVQVDVEGVGYVRAAVPFESWTRVCFGQAFLPCKAILKVKGT